MLSKLWLYTICMFVLLMPPASAESTKEKFIMKIATMAPKSVGWAKHIRNIIHPAIKKYSDDQVGFQYYWGGSLGNDADYIKLMQSGQLDGAALSGQGVVLAIPEMAVMELPFIFKNFEEIDYIRPKMTPTFDRIAASHGYKIIAWADQDFDQIYSSGYKMVSLEDFKKAKMLSWYGVLEEKLFDKLGADYKRSDVGQVSGLIRKGVCDTAIMPALWIVGSQLYTILKYVNPMPIRYSPAMTLCTTKRWHAIPKHLRVSLKKNKQEPMRQFRLKVREDTEKALQAMSNYGIELTFMPEDEHAKIKAKSREFWYEMAGQQYSRELLEELLAHLSQFRKQSKK